MIVLGHLTEAQCRAYRIADNKLTEMGGWDDALLAAELRELASGSTDQQGSFRRSAAPFPRIT